MGKECFETFQSSSHYFVWVSMMTIRIVYVLKVLACLYSLEVKINESLANRGHPSIPNEELTLNSISFVHWMIWVCRAFPRMSSRNCHKKILESLRLLRLWIPAAASTGRGGPIRRLAAVTAGGAVEETAAGGRGVKAFIAAITEVWSVNHQIQPS